jgi:hypothetical protein
MISWFPKKDTFMGPGQYMWTVLSIYFSGFLHINSPLLLIRVTNLDSWYGIVKYPVKITLECYKVLQQSINIFWLSDYELYSLVCLASYDIYQHWVKASCHITAKLS